MTYFKKLFFSIAAFFLLLNASEVWAENVVLHTPNDFQVLSVSPNGKWACGVFVDLTMTPHPFRWNLESGSIDILGSKEGVAWDVANDGTVSGDYPDTEVLPNHAPINLPCYWRGLTRYGVEMPDGTISDGMGCGISPDGRFMTGSICRNDIYTPYIWKDGSISRSLNTGAQAVSYCVAPDGEMAAGFSTKYNRTACLWPSEGATLFFEDSPQYSMGPWNYSRNFSPDGTKLLYWGGWELSEDESSLYLYSIYDIATGERKKVQAPSIESDMEFFDISNNELLVGFNHGRGYVHVADVGGMYIDDYLAMRGVNIASIFDDFYSGNDYYVGQLPISNVVAVSEDEKVFVMQYYNTIGETASLVLKIDQDFTAVAPVEVKAGQLDGLYTVGITWKRPVGANNIRGYNIYRDGQKLNGFLPISQLYYYDSKAAVGEHTYTIAAVTTAGVETKADDVVVTVAEPAKAAPYSVFARQKGVNAGFVTWKAPMNNIIHKHYFDVETVDYSGFAVYQDVDMEVAIRYSKEEMANYAGKKIAEVSFIPMAEHKSWALNLYTHDADNNLQKIYSQPISQQLTYGVLNTIPLAVAQTVPAGDLIVAIEISVDSSNSQLVGTQTGMATPGYTDLLRLVDEETFISAYESSMESVFLTQFTWAIDLGLTDESAEPAKVDHYNVYLDGEVAGTTSLTSFEMQDMADGVHTVALEVEYSDGTKSALQSQSLLISANYPGVSQLEVAVSEEDASEITATWQAPLDNDQTKLSHATEWSAGIGVHGNSSSSYAFMIGSEYQPQMLRGYDGYRIKAFRFIPMSDAIFTFFLYENGNLICELEAEEMKFKEWNTYYLPDEIRINENSVYRLVIDCFDPVPEADVFALDGDLSKAYVSDLYSTDNGETWGSLYDDTGRYGNWMMGMVVEDADGRPLVVDGYDVAVDNRVVNTSKITANTFTYNLLKDGAHKLQVNTYYPDVEQSVDGESTTFVLELTAIRGLKADSHIQLVRGSNSLEVRGEGIQAVTIYNASGAQVTKAFSEKVDIAGLTPGIYVVKVETSNGNVTHRIVIE